MKMGLLITLGALLWVGCKPDGGNEQVEVLSEMRSPNGTFIASSFACSGGGAAGYFYFNANLRRAGEALDSGDGLLGKHKTWKAFTDIQIRWIDDANLEVSYQQDEAPAYRENNGVRVDSKYGIKMHYLVVPPGPAVVDLDD